MLLFHYIFPYLALTAGIDYYCIAEKLAKPQTFGICKNYQVYDQKELNEELYNNFNGRSLKFMIMLPPGYSKEKFEFKIDTRENKNLVDISINCYDTYRTEVYFLIRDTLINSGNMRNVPLHVTQQYFKNPDYIYLATVDERSNLKTIKIVGILPSKNYNPQAELVVIGNAEPPTILLNGNIIDEVDKEPIFGNYVYYYDLQIEASVDVVDQSWSYVQSKVKGLKKKIINLNFSQAMISSGTLELSDTVQKVKIIGSIFGSIEFTKPDVAITFSDLYTRPDKDLTVKLRSKCVKTEEDSKYTIEGITKYNSLVTIYGESNFKNFDLFLEDGCEKKSGSFILYYNSIPKMYDVHVSRANIFIYYSYYDRLEEAGENIAYGSISVHYDYSLYAIIGFSVVGILIIVGIVICCVKCNRKRKNKREKSNSDVDIDGKSNNFSEI